MLSAALSHEMKTPLNAILSLITKFEKYVNDKNGKRYL
jgi:signal transduction histidine kinase